MVQSWLPRASLGASGGQSSPNRRRIPFDGLTQRGVFEMHMPPGLGANRYPSRPRVREKPLAKHCSLPKITVIGDAAPRGAVQRKPGRSPHELAEVSRSGLPGVAEQARAGNSARDRRRRSRREAQVRKEPGRPQGRDRRDRGCASRISRPFGAVCRTNRSKPCGIAPAGMMGKRSWRPCQRPCQARAQGDGFRRVPLRVQASEPRCPGPAQ